MKPSYNIFMVGSQIQTLIQSCIERNYCYMVERKKGLTIYRRETELVRENVYVVSFGLDMAIETHGIEDIHSLHVDLRGAEPKDFTWLDTIFTSAKITSGYFYNYGIHAADLCKKAESHGFKIMNTGNWIYFHH